MSSSPDSDYNSVGDETARPPPPLERRDTFTVDAPAAQPSPSKFGKKKDQRNDDLLNTTMHAGGIRAILEKANSHFVFPAEVKNYIASHFRMIREENDGLRDRLETAEERLGDLEAKHRECKSLRRDVESLSEQLKQTKGNLEREKAKSKVMAKKIKARGGDDDEQFGVIWMGTGSNNNDDCHDGASEGDRGGSSIRDRSESADKRDPAKKIKAYKSQITGYKSEVAKLKEVLLRELGSTALVEEALKSEGSNWHGREEKLRQLEDTLASTKALLASKERELAYINGGNNADNYDNSLRLRCQVAEVERDRLTELIGVVSERTLAAESAASRAEQVLRQERRKSAKLEQLLERAHVNLRDSGNLSGNGLSSSQHLVRMGQENTNAELESLKKELERSKRTREQDLATYLKAAADVRKAVEAAESAKD